MRYKEHLGWQSKVPLLLRPGSIAEWWHDLRNLGRPCSATCTNRSTSSPGGGHSAVAARTGSSSVVISGVAASHETLI